MALPGIRLIAAVYPPQLYVLSNPFITVALTLLFSKWRLSWSD